MDHEDLFEDVWEGLRDEWISYLENDALSITSNYARHTMIMSKTLEMERNIFHLSFI